MCLEISRKCVEARAKVEMKKLDAFDLFLQGRTNTMESIAIIRLASLLGHDGIKLSNNRVQTCKNGRMLFPIYLPYLAVDMLWIMMGQ